MKIATQNVRGFPQMPPEKSEHDISTVRALGGVDIFQEMWSPQYRRQIRDLPHTDGTKFPGSALITWGNRTYKLIQSRVDVLHGGLAGVCDPRKIVSAKLQRLDNHQHFWAVDAHFVPGGWAIPPKRDRDARRRLWREGQRNLLRVVSELAQDGIPIVGGMDINRKSYDILGNVIDGRPVHYHGPRNTVITLWTVNGLRNEWDVHSVSTLDRKRFGMFTDHNGIILDAGFVNTLGEHALQRAQLQSHHGPKFGLGECFLQTRQLYGALAVGDFDHNGRANAVDGWKAAKHRHPTSDVNDVPRGYPMFWSGGSHGDGHVGISAGNGKMWSTDILRTGFYDFVPARLITAKWGLTFLGWTEDIGNIHIGN